MLLQTNKKGFEIIFSKNIPLKHMVSEMSGRGNVLVLKCPVSAGEVFGRGIVRSGKCQSGKSPSGKCQSGNCPVGKLSTYQNIMTNIV